jgi:hypothetical protein
MHIGRRAGDLNIGLVETGATSMAWGRHGTPIDRAVGLILIPPTKAISEGSLASISQLF